MAAPVKERKPRHQVKGGTLERRNYYGILFCLPFVIVFLVFNIYPVFRTLHSVCYLTLSYS